MKYYILNTDENRGNCPNLIGTYSDIAIGDNRAVIEVNGVWYDANIDSRIIEVLENSRKSKDRLVLHYGDYNTGKAWGDKCIGFVGNSTGMYKIPILVYNRRCFGGQGILEHCIVKIEYARYKMPAYIHPNYHI